MKIINCEQRSEEWFKIRQLKLTASKAQTIAVANKGLDTLCRELVIDFNKIQEVYTNEDIERGIKLESEAIAMFEFETGLDVEEVGFIVYNDFVGCSPDGLTSDDGLVECKAYNDKNFFNFLVDRKIDPKYIAQMQMQMQISSRKHCYFIVYNPNYKKSLIIEKVLYDENFALKLENGYKVGENKIKEYLEYLK